MICPHSSFYPIGPSDCIWRLSVLIIVAFVQPAHFCLFAACVFCAAPHARTQDVFGDGSGGHIFIAGFFLKEQRSRQNVHHATLTLHHTSS
jgi:hypothetical protein